MPPRPTTIASNIKCPSGGAGGRWFSEPSPEPGSGALALLRGGARHRNISNHFSPPELPLTVLADKIVLVGGHDRDFWPVAGVGHQEAAACESRRVAAAHLDRFVHVEVHVPAARVREDGGEELLEQRADSVASFRGEIGRAHVCTPVTLYSRM